MASSSIMMRMARVTRFTAFEDAFYFFNQAKGLPTVSTSEPMMERYVRVSILLSWIAFEEAVKGSTQMLLQRGKITAPVPKRPYDRLAFLLSALSKPVPAQSDFMKMRKIRNDIAHANEEKQYAFSYMADDALSTFKFCLDAATSIWPYDITVF